MSNLTNLEKSLQNRIDEAAKSTNQLRTRSKMFKNEPLSYDLMIIGEYIGQAKILCDILRVDYGKNVKETENEIEKIRSDAYEIFKELTNTL